MSTCRQTNRGRKLIYWDMVLNNYTELECDYVIDLFEEVGESFVIGKEVGESGTPHLQACIKLKKANYESYIYGLMKRKGLVNEKGNCRCSIRPGRNIEALAEYCRKGGEIIADKNMDKFKLKKKITEREHMKRLHCEIYKERDEAMYKSIREVYQDKWEDEWKLYIKYRAQHLMNNFKYNYDWRSLENSDES